MDNTLLSRGADGKTVPVMHACGHDMHTTCLLGALNLLARARESWSGKILAVFQPAEELGGGARSMVDDNLFDRFGLPEVCLGQHVVPAPAGSDIPSNHQSTYAPLIQPTLTTGVTALTSAALAWLAPGGHPVAPG